MTAIGQFYPENGMMNFTCKLADFLRPYTRSYTRSVATCEEILSMGSVAANQALEMELGGAHEPLTGNRRDWARFALCGSAEPKFAVRFTIFHEPQGPVLDCCLAGAFMPVGFASNHGARYESIEQLLEALECVGLPGEQICSFLNKVYFVTRPQLHVLRLAILGN